MHIKQDPLIRTLTLFFALLTAGVPAFAQGRNPAVAVARSLKQIKYQAQLTNPSRLVKIESPALVRSSSLSSGFSSSQLAGQVHERALQAQAAQISLATPAQYVPQISSARPEILPYTFQARPREQFETNFVTGTVFKTKAGEIFGVVTTHTISQPKIGFMLQKDFIADVFDASSGKFISLPAQVVQLSSPAMLDVALLKFRPEDEKYLSPVELSTRAPEWDDKLHSQGFSWGKAVYVPNRIFEGETPYTIRTSMTNPRSERRGLCGSVLLNEQNQAVGIHTGSNFSDLLAEDFDTGYATKVSFLEKLVEAYHNEGKSTFSLTVGKKKLLDLNIDEYVTEIAFLDEDNYQVFHMNFPYRFSYSRLRDALATYAPRYLHLTVHRVYWDAEDEGYMTSSRYDKNAPVKIYRYDVKKDTYSLLEETSVPKRPSFFHRLFRR